MQQGKLPHQKLPETIQSPNKPSFPLRRRRPRPRGQLSPHPPCSICLLLSLAVGPKIICRTQFVHLQISEEFVHLHISEPMPGPSSTQSQTTPATSRTLGRSDGQGHRQIDKIYKVRPMLDSPLQQLSLNKGHQDSHHLAIKKYIN